VGHFWKAPKSTLPSELANVVRLCLRGPGYSVSQELAAIWISEGQLLQSGASLYKMPARLNEIIEAGMNAHRWHASQPSVFGSDPPELDNRATSGAGAISWLLAPLDTDYAAWIEARRA
jgi:hypothetical protein